MDMIHESNDHIEFRSNLPWPVRMIFLIFGLFPLLAPYELMVKPSWSGKSTLIGLFFPLVISVGAVALSGLFVLAALLGLSQRIRFDTRCKEITYTFNTAVLRRVKRFPFSAVETLNVRPHSWSDGPDTHNLVLKLNGYRDIEFGHFSEHSEAKRYLAALQNLIERRDAR